ncbi:MAG: PAS domain S-box protein [Thermodesulfobacteriota bacterium]|nr:PAS domain S-box protein [Thermodesulfobacteriota bacterium]
MHIKKIVGNFNISVLEDEMRSLYQRFRSLVEMSDEGILVLNEDYSIEYANLMASDITGYPAEELIGKDFSLMEKKFIKFLRETILPQNHSNSKFYVNSRIRTAKGDYKDIQICFVQVPEKDNKIKTNVYLRDISKRKNFEKALKKSEEKYSNLFERSRHGIFISNKDEGRFLDCNQAMLDMLGYENKEEFLSIDIARDLYQNPMDRKIFQKIIEKKGFVKDYEINFKKRDGSKIPILLTAHIRKNEQGEIIGYEGINIDISERKKIENELRHANDFFYNLIESSVDGIIAADIKGNIIIFNKSAEELLGSKSEEVIGKVRITEIYPPGMAHNIMKKIRSNEYGGKGRLKSIKVTVINKNGEDIPISLSGAMLYDNGREIASVGIFTDLREKLKMEEELKQSQAQLLHSEKMSSLGKLSASVVHEINNPLTGILTYIKLMLRTINDNSFSASDIKSFVKYLNLMEAETSRCGKIVSNLLAFSRQTKLEIQDLDINTVLDRILLLSEHQIILQNIKIKKLLKPDLPKISGDFGKLEQTFLDIIFNAIEAMPDGGVLTIKTLYKTGNKYLELKISDTGKGIPKDNLPVIFDPFFTTKKEGKGVGLGLSVVYGIIKDHRGVIEVKSEVNKGSTFIIKLPVKEYKKTSRKK